MPQRLHEFHKKHDRRVRLFMSLTIFVFGVVCIILSETVRGILPFLLSALLLLLAGDNLYEALSDRTFDEEDTDEISNAIIYIILAVVVLLQRHVSDNLIGAIWGILALLLASRNISHSLYSLIHRHGSVVGHVLHLIQAAISIGISILLLLDPPAHLHFHVYILGLELIDYAVRIAFNEV
ncbi:MAG: hypothetical protein II882_10315 [Lachnospiraceae bacterium]|nr:hypothetical protein [Lachnospiraceae bacterium]